MMADRLDLTFLWITTVALWLVEPASTQTSDLTEAPAASSNDIMINLNREFSLLWYHWVAVFVVCFLVVVIMMPSSVCLYRLYKKKPQIRVIEKEVEGQTTFIRRDETDGADMDAVFRHMDCDYKEIPREDITITGTLGIGEFGPLYDAEVKISANDIQRAMVKEFKQGTMQDLVRFREEVERVKSLDHPRVASLFGVVSKSPYYLVAELGINGDLKTFLSNSRDKEDLEGKLALDVPKLVAMGADVASGLSYLQCVNYVHRDIAARNCMVTDDLCIKLGDFKVGRFLHRSEYAVQIDGSLMPLRWMAPESITDNTFTVQSSTWSFGVLLWEVMSTGEFPFSRLSDDEVANDVGGNRTRLSRPHDCPDRVYKVMTECWSHDSRSRPHMNLVHRLLESSILTNKYDQSHVRLYT